MVGGVGRKRHPRPYVNEGWGIRGLLGYFWQADGGGGGRRLYRYRISNCIKWRAKFMGSRLGSDFYFARLLTMNRL